MTWRYTALATSAFFLCRAFSQQPAKLQFEAASINLHNPDEDDDLGLRFLPGGRMISRGVPLRALIAEAYRLPAGSKQVSGGPEWTLSEDQGVYDIEAKAEDGAVPAGLTVAERDGRIAEMLRELLVSRFKMMVHRETREMATYALVVLKSGYKMRPASAQEKECNLDAHPNCRGFSDARDLMIHARAVSVADLVRVLQPWSDRPIVDQTGIEGLFDFDMPLPFPTDADPSHPTIFTAIAPIGFKLESKKEPIEILVVDYLEKPSPN